MIPRASGFVAELPPLPRESAFAPFLSGLAATGDIVLSEPAGLGIAALFKTGVASILSDERIGRVMELVPPARPAVVADRDRSILATGPGAWLVLRENAPADWANELEAAVADAAAVVDQSSAYAVLRLEGDVAWRLLAKGAFIDLDPQAFSPGKAVTTVIAHIGVILWRRPDVAAFEIAVFRSYAGSFWHWLKTAAEAEGLRLGRSARL